MTKKLTFPDGFFVGVVLQQPTNVKVPIMLMGVGSPMLTWCQLVRIAFPLSLDVARCLILRMVIFIRPRKVSICTTVTRKILLSLVKWALRPIDFLLLGHVFFLRVMRLSQMKLGLPFTRTSSRNVINMALNPW